VSEAHLAATQQTLDAIAAQAMACTRCPLHATRQLAVPGAGPANARLMFVGEAPGPEEDRAGQPFIAASGQFLAELLDLIGVRREDVYLTNVVKCHPPEKRSPLPGEMDACSDYLSRQIETLDPEVIVTLGATSLARLLPGAKLSAVHGQPQQVGGRILVPMYHPAAAMYQSRYRSILVKDFLAMEEFLSNHSP
jgi:DNA polymerase